MEHPKASSGEPIRAQAAAGSAQTQCRSARQRGVLRQLEQQTPRSVASLKACHASGAVLALCGIVPPIPYIGKVSNEGTEVFLTREELGQMAGTALFTFSRILSRWAQQGVVGIRLCIQ